MNLLNLAKVSKKLITSQRQTVTELLEKNHNYKSFISNQRTKSLLDVDYQIILKIFASRLKKTLPNIILSQQSAYVAQRCINESGRLISDLLSVTKTMKVKRDISTIDIEKLFDSLDHTFLISALEKFGFGKLLQIG